MTYADIRRRLIALGCEYLLVKTLQPNNNSKNQIYVGKSLEALNTIPNRGLTPPAKEGEKARARVSLEWLLADGTTAPAPHAKLVFYDQYPEVRLSALLLGARGAPSRLLNTEISGRVLLLGVKPTGQLVAWMDGPRSSLASDIRLLIAERRATAVSAFWRIELESPRPRSARALLLRELKRLHGAGWIPGETLLADGTRKPNNAQNAGGCTLEAALGIPKDSAATPDFHGWELKTFGLPKFTSRARSAKVTLMTPEPTRGLYGSAGIEAFLRTYGYPPRNGAADRLNYSFEHKVGNPRPNPDTGHTLTLRLGGVLESPDGVLVPDLRRGSLVLVDENRRIAAGWRFEDLLEHWEKKHALAAYVPTLSRKVLGRREFHFGPWVFLGTGTDFGRLLAALQARQVWYGPGTNLQGCSGPSAKAHPRSQFRTTIRDVPALYETWETVDVV